MYKRGQTDQLQQKLGTFVVQFYLWFIIFYFVISMKCLFIYFGLILTSSLVDVHGLANFFQFRTLYTISIRFYFTAAKRTLYR